MGPHPYPWMVREFQSIIGTEARRQCLALLGRDPDFVVACVGGGSNAAGTFAGFVGTSARLVGVEAAGGAAMGRQGMPGVLHGMRSYLLQDELGQILEAHSISAGLDYPGIGPNTPTWPIPAGPATAPPTMTRSWTPCSCWPVGKAYIPALEPAHALAWLVKAVQRGEVPAGATVLLTMSGRGDKDAEHVMKALAQRDRP